MTDRLTSVGQPSFRQSHVAQSPTTNKLNRRLKVRTTALLQAGLHDSAMLASGVNEPLTFFDRVRDRLLQIDIFARLAGHHTHDRVPMIRRRDDDRVDASIIQHATKVRLPTRCFSADLFDGPDRRLVCRSSLNEAFVFKAIEQLNEHKQEIAAINPLL